MNMNMISTICGGIMIVTMVIAVVMVAINIFFEPDGKAFRAVFMTVLVICLVSGLAFAGIGLKFACTSGELLQKQVQVTSMDDRYVRVVDETGEQYAISRAYVTVEDTNTLTVKYWEGMTSAEGLTLSQETANKYILQQ